MDLVKSQEARAIIDRILGFELSQLLMRHTGKRKNVSAGRVMSVALKLILEKETNIANFLTSQYFTVNGIFNGNKAVYNTRFQSKEEVYQLLNDLKNDSNCYVITSSEKTKVEKKPLMPFVLSVSSLPLSLSISLTLTLTLVCIERDMSTILCIIRNSSSMFAKSL